MKKLARLRFIISICTALFLSLIIIFFIRSSKKLFLTHSEYTIKSIVQDKSASIAAEANYAATSIKLLSDFVSSQMTERELKNPNEILSRYSGHLPFDLVEYIRWDGLNFMNSIAGEEPFDASSRPYYTEGIQGKSGIWPNFKPKVAQEVLLNFYSPLYYEGEISGVITGAIREASSLKSRLISSFFGHQVQSFICDQDYIVISSACEDIYPGLDLKKWTSIKLIEDLIEHSETDNTEPFKYEINGSFGLCGTGTLPVNNWHVAVIVYPSVLKEVEKETSGSLFTISIIIIVVLFMYLTASLKIQAKINSLVQEELKNAATRDRLTGLLNRHAYEDKLAALESIPLKDDLHYVVFDVNGLKNINDTMGHEAGDELIKAAATCIDLCFGKYGSTFRTGGDEFIAIIHATDEQLEQIKENFRQETENWKGQYVSSLRVPAGIVSRKEMPDATIMEIIKAADKRMYDEKSIIYISSGVDRRAKNEAYKVICESYKKILKINLLEDSFEIIQMDPNERENSKGYHEKISLWLQGFGTSGLVHPDDMQAYLQKTSLEFLKEYFNSGKDELSIQYRRMIGNSFRRVLMEIEKAEDYSEQNQNLFLYVKDIDKE